MDLGDNDG